MSEIGAIGPKEWESWFDKKDFTSDWSSRAFPTWIRCLSHLRDDPLKILELGAWEARASLFLLNLFPNSHLTCVDIFTLGNEGRFDSNVSEYGDRVRKVKGRSVVELDNMLFGEGDRVTFDLIYIDGSHDRDDVIIDSILCWRLLNVGGIVIWDDYEMLAVMPGPFTRDQDPKPAIDVFLAWRDDELAIIDRGYQLIAQKVKPHYVSAHG